MTPNSQLGPYRITASLGAGGMGEVYRATDTRLGREVAIKVLPGDFATDAERLRRFEQEARATGALNHPNILSIFDVGQHEGTPFVVAELLEGETLRDRLGGTHLPFRKAVDYATQLAEGLAAAHDRGVVHRDLKPENIFITKDGRLKILDFGLARITTPFAGEAAGASQVPTTPVGTDPGVVLGTVGYMSPEQVRGRPADVRSDIFAFGTVLYEMVSGQRAFRRASAVETMNAILKEDPPEISTFDHGAPPAIQSIVTHCLEKQPEERFQSAHDIAFNLRTLSEISSSKTAAVIGGKPRIPRKLLMAAAIVAAIFVGAAGVYLLAPPAAPPPSFKRLTFRRGEVFTASFGPGGSVIYSGAFNGPPQIFSVVLPATDARFLGWNNAGLLSVSRNGEMAILRDAKYLKPFTVAGTLSLAPLGGGTPRDVAEHVQDAAWDPEGKALAVVRSHASGEDQIEYPIGTMIYRSNGRTDYIRFSPDGKQIAFLDHPMIGSDSGSVAVIDLNGKKRDLTKSWSSAQGLAWSPKTGEIWFTASASGSLRALYGVTLSGKQRLIARVPSSLVLFDVSDDGRALLALYEERNGLAFRGRDDSQERDLSWLDWGVLRDIAGDGSAILFDETGEGAGDAGVTFLRATDGSPAVRLTAGTACSISPDGKWVVARTQEAPRQLVQVPTGAGQMRRLTNDKTQYVWGALLPDNRRFAMLAFEEGSGNRLYVANLDGSGRHPVSPPGMKSGTAAVSPDGKWIGISDATPKAILYPIDAGTPRVVGDLDDESVAGFSADSRYAYVARREAPMAVTRVEIATGRRQPWMMIQPTVRPPSANMGALRIATDGKSYAYAFRDAISTLYLAEGLR